MTKRIMLSILLIFAIILPFACTRQPEISQSDAFDIAVSDNENEKLLLSLEPEKCDTQIISCDKFTLARTYSGDIMFTGNCISVFREKDELSDCFYITAKDETAAGIKQNGTVTVIGKNKELLSDSKTWTDIISVALGHDFMLGLRSDGTVVSCGSNSYGKCDTDGLFGCVQIACGRNHAAALMHDGTVRVWGAYTDEQIKDGITSKDIKKIVCGDFSVVALTNDGEVQSFNADDVTSWKSVADICAYDDSYAALTDEGIITTQEYSAEPLNIENMNSFSASSLCIAIERTDGTVEVYGDDEDMQNDTSLWHTGVTFDEKSGYITGLPEKTAKDEAERIIAMAAGKAVRVDTYGAYACTGTKVYDETGNEIGTIVIYGDVNGDGMINMDDARLIKAHTDGQTVLTGVYEKAAHVLHTLSEVGKLGEAEINAVTEHYTGASHIRQFSHDVYREDLVKYHNINDDVVGYIRVEGTQIDYFIIYGDNYYYSDHDIYKHHSHAGCIYSLSGSHHKNNLALGHNMRRSGTMFHGLHKIEDRGEKLLVFKNRVVTVTLNGECGKWEIYAIYETPEREPVSTQLNNIRTLDDDSNEDIQAWIDGQIARSTSKLYADDVTYEDELLTMYTCGDVYHEGPDQARLYLFLRRVG